MSDTPTAGTPDTVSETPAATGGPRLTLGQAVRTTGMSRSTLQRRLRDDSIPGATRTPGGGWSIPVAGLIAAGLAPRHSPPDPPVSGNLPIATSRGAEVTADPATESYISVEPAEVERLRVELNRTRADLELSRARVAEVTADRETLRAALEALSRALPPGPVLTAPPAPAARRRWWGKPR